MKWDSDRVERTIEELIDLVRKGEVSPEINTQTLRNLGGNFEKLYFSAFRRDGKRPGWAVERFPNGFHDLVGEIETRLEDDGIEVIDIKRELSDYVAHTKRELSDIAGVKELLDEGNMLAEEALKTIREFGIELSPWQEKKFSSNGNSKTDLDSLLAKAEKNRKEHMDLSNLDCVKGLLFQSLVGVYLTEKHGRENVTHEPGMPVAYKDLNGSSHSVVYPDYVIGTDQIVEVKWRNNYENIIDSVLPQIFAFQRRYRKMPAAKVVCREKCPSLEAMFLENAILRQEAIDMELPELSKRVKELFSYVTFEELVSTEEDRELYKQALSEIDSVSSEGSLDLMRNYTLAFNQISKNGENVLEKLKILTSKMQERYKFNDKEFVDLFGAVHKDELQSDDYGRRLRIVQRNIDASRKRLILDIYNRRFDTSHKRFSEDMRDELDNLPEQEFQELYDKIYEEKQKVREERIKNRKKRTYSLDERLAMHGKILEKRFKQEILYMDLILENIDHAFAEHKILKDGVDRKIELEREIFEEKKYGLNPPDILADYLILNKLTDLPKESVRSGVRVIESIGTNLNKITDQFLDKLTDEILEESKAKNKTFFDLGRIFCDPIGGKIISLMDSVARSYEHLRKNSGLAEAIEKAVELIKTGHGSRRERRIVHAYQTKLFPNTELYKLMNYRSFLNSLANISSINGYCGNVYCNRVLKKVFGYNGTQVKRQAYKSKLFPRIIKLEARKVLDNLTNVHSMRGYVKDNIEELGTDISKTKAYLKREIKDLKTLVFTGGHDIEGFKLERIIGNANTAVTSTSTGESHEAMRDLEDMLISLNGLFASGIYETFAKNILPKKEHPKDIDRYLKLSETVPDINDEVNSRLSKENTAKIYQELYEKRVLHWRLVQDYLSDKLNCAKVIAETDPSKAVEYVNQNRIEYDASFEDAKVFAGYLDGLRKKDRELLDRYLPEENRK